MILILLEARNMMFGRRLDIVTKLLHPRPLQTGMFCTAIKRDIRRVNRMIGKEGINYA